MSNHNKKRNVGIIYEQLILRAAAAMIDNDTKTVETCSRIIKKYYRPGTEIFKEHRLFKALVDTTVKSENVGMRIMQEAKRGAHMFSTQQLDQEKSNLIREINKSLDDPNFFNQNVKNYRLYATVQTLMNDWRRDDESSFERVIQYEQKLLERLQQDKSQAPTFNELTESRVTPLSVKIMNEKFEKKWSTKLNDTQRSLIRDYVHGKVDVNALESIKNRALRGLLRLKESTESQVLLEKLDVVRKNVEEIDSSRLDDTGIVKFMHLTHLYQELENKDE